MKLPEQPGEAPESFDKAEWLRLQKVGTFFAINKGREMGVPQEELDRFAREVIARETEKGNHDLARRLKESLGMNMEGTESPEQTDKPSKKERKLTTPEKAAEMIRKRRLKYGLGEPRDLTPEEANEIQKSIDELLVRLDECNYFSFGEEVSRKGSDVENEASVGGDRELAKAVLKEFVDALSALKKVIE